MLYEFAGYELDDQRFELRFRGALVPVQRRVFDTIVYLIARRGRVVTKDELMAGPWQGGVVSDAALDRAIMLARRALQKVGDGLEPIQTVRGRGYLWVSPVRTADDPACLPLSPRPSDRLGSGSSKPLLGRDAELDALRGRFNRAMTGTGSLVLIEGAPGVGKTRLVERFAEVAIDGGANVLCGRCWEAGGAPALWPWIQVLRSHVERHASEALPGSQRTLIDTLATLLPGLRRDGEWPIADPETSRTRFRMFDRLTQVLGAAARSRSMVILLEDLHAADDSSLLFLQFFTRFVAELPILIVATHRDLHLPESPVLSSFVTGTPPNSYKLRIAGLSELHLRPLLASIVHDPPPAFVAEIHRSTDGNPFLAEEFARLAVAEQQHDSENVAAALAHFRMPDRIADAVRRHINTLPAGTRELLSGAAVVGLVFDVGLVAEVSGASCETEAEVLAPAFRTGLLHERGEVGRYGFAHALIRETIYRDLSPHRRCDLHRRVTEALERLYGGAEDLVLPQLAHHSFHAVPVGDEERCIEYASRAAEQSLRAAAYELAARHYATALNVLGSRAAALERRARLLLALGDARRLAGKNEEAVASYEELCELGRCLHQPRLVAEGVLGIAEVRHLALMIDGPFAARLADALAGLGASDDPLRAQLLGYLAVATYHTRPIDDRIAMSTEALVLARRLGDRRSLQSALRAHHWTVFQTVQGLEAMGLVDEMAVLAREANDPESLLEAALWEIADRLGAGDPSAMSVKLVDYAQLAQRYAHPVHLWWTSLLRSTEASLRADYASAERLAKESFELGLPLDEFSARTFFAAQACTISFETDGGASIESMGQPILEHLPWFAAWRTALALVWVLNDRHDEAADELQRLARNEFAAIREDANAISSLSYLARVAVALGDARLARTLYRRLLPFEGRVVVIATGVACWGPSNYYLGLLAACFGDDASARRHFGAAHAQARGLRALASAAWIDFEYGCLLARAKSRTDQRRGRGLIDRARTFAERSGMRVLSQRIDTTRVS